LGFRYSQVSFLTRKRRNRNRRKKRVTEKFVERKDELVREETSEGTEYTIACFQELSHYSPAVTEKNYKKFCNGI
jgi:phosphoribosylamine-glycine ligase